MDVKLGNSRQKKTAKRLGLRPVEFCTFAVHAPIHEPQQVGTLGVAWVHLVSIPASSSTTGLRSNTTGILQFCTSRSSCAPEGTSPQAAGVLHRWMTGQRRTSARRPLNRARAGDQQHRSEVCSFLNRPLSLDLSGSSKLWVIRVSFHATNRVHTASARQEFRPACRQPYTSDLRRTSK